MQDGPDKKSLILPSPAKLNLMLHILGRREDGYHELQTLFQFLDYGDEMTFAVRDDGVICLHTEFPGVPHDENLIVKAAKKLQAQSGCALGIDIWIDKILPMGGGIGGGSSNAATTLLGLNHLWKLGWDLDRLAALGRHWAPTSRFSCMGTRLLPRAWEKNSPRKTPKSLGMSCLSRKYL